MAAEEVVEYDLQKSDLEAFAAFHATRSDYGRRQNRKDGLTYGAMFAVPLGGLGLLIGDPILATLGFVVGVAMFFLVPTLNRRHAAKQMHRMLGSSAGSSQATGWHRLSLTDSELVEESTTGSTRTRLELLGPVNETKDILIVYISQVAAHIVPRGRMSRGNLESFVSRLHEQIEVTRARGSG